ncbi:FtsX-like permease family protein [Dactylosporangium sp. NPDC049742]|uniref:FtsX-like permease family protein n=1 Tax=Dactylosporangium sp. NPDC049742 TaxID=3154737 RepID=UPI0034388141
MPRTVRRFAGAFVAVAVGIALVTAATLLFASGRPQVPDRLAAAGVVVRSVDAVAPADSFPPPVPLSSDAATALAGRLAAIPGVAAAVPDRTFYMQAIVDGRPYAADGRRQDAREGHGWASAQLGGLRLTAGTAPRGPSEVVVDRALGLSPGDRVTLLTAAGPTSYTVSGTVDSPGFHVTDEVAAALAPGVDTIGLMLRPGADPTAVASAARAVTGTGARVLTGDDRGALEPRDDARMRWIGMQVLTAVAALSGFVTVFVVASTFAFAVAQRRREFGLLRAVGATPRQIRRTVQGEALAVGAAGSVVGMLAGTAAATPLGWALVDAGFEPATFRVRLVAWPFVVALTAGPVVALAGAWSAARRAARVRPLEALREAVVEQRPMGWARWVTGLLLVAAGAALGVGTATSGSAQHSATFALYSMMALVSGVTVLAPAVVGPVVRLLRSPLPSRGGAIGMLVRGSALTAARRTASTAAPVLLTVSFAVLVSGMVRTSTGAYAAGRSARVDAGWVVAPDRAPGLSDAAVAAVPGAAILPTTVFVPPAEGGAGRASRTAFGVDPAAFAAVNRRLEVVSGSLADLRGDDTVVLTTSAAAVASATGSGAAVGTGSAGASGGAMPSGGAGAAGSAGSSGGAGVAGGGAGRGGVPGVYPVMFADGTVVALRVVAVVTDASIPGDMVLPRAVVRAHEPSALTSAVFVRDRVEVPAGSGARVVDVGTWAAEQDSAEDRLVWMFTVLLIAVSAGYGAIAVANTLLMAAAGRAADLRAVRLAGATRRQVLRLVTAESALVVLIGAALGGVVALGALLSIRAGLAEQVGAPVELVVPWTVVGGVVGLCLLLAVAASAVPTLRTLRSGPVQEPL